MTGSTLRFQCWMDPLEAGGQCLDFNKQRGIRKTKLKAADLEGASCDRINLGSGC